MDALAMGGYGAYVWSCFGLALIVILWSDWRSRARHNQVYQEIEGRIRALEEHQ